MELAKKELSIKDKAKAELVEERTKGHVKEMKEKLKAIEAAKIVVSNFEREIQDLELKIEQETNAIMGQ